MNLSDIASLVHDARSCRRFVEADPIPESILLSLVDVARQAPSSRNQQALRFAVVSGASECARIFPCFKWATALSWEGPSSGERATGYIIFVKSAGAHTEHDSGIAAMTMKLAAHAAGYASCMLGAIDRPALARLLGLLEGQEIDIAMAFGRSGERVSMEILPANASSTAYWRDAAGTHHVPKLPLEALLIRSPRT